MSVCRHELGVQPRVQPPPKPPAIQTLDFPVTELWPALLTDRNFQSPPAMHVRLRRALKMVNARLILQLRRLIDRTGQ